jgi:LysR substrate binding domain-containing protein
LRYVFIGPLSSSNALWNRPSPMNKLKSARELWERDWIEEPLISLPTSESIYQNFQALLSKLGVDWFPAIEVSTIDLVETYVANGYGIGLSIAVPKKKPRPDLRALALDDFPPVSFGMLWQGKPTPILEAFLTASHQATQALMTWPQILLELALARLLQNIASQFTCPALAKGLRSFLNSASLPAPAQSSEGAVGIPQSGTLLCRGPVRTGRGEFCLF